MQNTLHLITPGQSGSICMSSWLTGPGTTRILARFADQTSKTLFETTDKIPAKISEAHYKAGLIIRPLPTVRAMALSPPLIITGDDVDKTLDCLETGLKSVFA